MSIFNNGLIKRLKTFGKYLAYLLIVMIFLAFFLTQANSLQIFSVPDEIVNVYIYLILGVASIACYLLGLHYLFYGIQAGFIEKNIKLNFDKEPTKGRSAKVRGVICIIISLVNFVPAILIDVYIVKVLIN